jgi:hypothetical protein
MIGTLIASPDNHADSVFVYSGDRLALPAPPDPLKTHWQVTTETWLVPPAEDGTVNVLSFQ